MRVRKSKRQSAWEFMRRNRCFKVGDVMSITQMGKQNMKLFLGQLKREGFVVPQSPNNLPLEEKVFTLVKSKSVVCPVKSSNGVTRKETR